MVKENSFVLENKNRTDFVMLRFGHAVVDSEWKGSVVDSVYSRLYYIIKGSFFITTEDNTTLLIEPGKWYLLPAGLSFDFGCEKEMEQIYFHIKLCGVDGIDLLRNCKKPVSIKANPDSGKFFLGCMGKADTISELKIQQKVYDILLSMIENNNVYIENNNLSPCVARAVEYINSHLSAQLSVSEIADNAFVSKSTLTKHFRKELKMSIHSYIYNTIMFEAGLILAGSKVSVHMVSEKFGFSDQFYFSRCFKEKFGMSPRDYRKMSL